MADEAVTRGQATARAVIQRLEGVKHDGTDVISLIIQPGERLSDINARLKGDYVWASNIPSRFSRISTLSAITTVQQKLKGYSEVPRNGLIIYTGTIIEDDKYVKITVVFEPYRPPCASLYSRDWHFHTEALHDLLEEE